MTVKNPGLWIAVAALAVGVIAMLFQRGQYVAATGSGNPFSMSTAGPTFNFGARSQGGGIAAPRVQMPTSSCGCGGSFGDYAVPELLPVFGETQRGIPYTPMPSPNDPRTIPTLGNGAMI